MPNIKNISSLRNYNDVLSEVEIGEPVFLTKKGTGEFAIVRMEEYDSLKSNAWDRFFAEAERGEQSAREHGWRSADEVERSLSLLGKQDG